MRDENRSTRPLRLVGGRVLGPEGLQDRDLVLVDGRIGEAGAGSGEQVLDVEGLWIMPGLIDLHGDGFEHHLAPRRGVATDLCSGLRTVEMTLAGAGITTAWLAQFWSWEGGMRGPDFARRLAQALQDVRPTLKLDLRMQLRFEQSMIEDGAAIRALVAEHGINYVVFNDHLPHERLAAGRTPPRLTGNALKAGRSPDAHLAEMKRLVARADKVPEFVSALAEDLKALGATLGSHDDTDRSARLHRGAQGLSVCEFPMSLAAAQAAKDRGEPVIMGAPNVVRAGSHNRGGVSAQSLIAEGLVDALASDYHYPTLLAATFALVDRQILPLQDAWTLVSSGPAEILGVADRGTLEQGKRADVILLDPERRQCVGVISRGEWVFAWGDLASGLAS
ncbi:MAG: alpha-D-ribose 1-methylphosphonate 5-triphosphate diphosphatase [Pseudomonadota bacterium]